MADCEQVLTELLKKIAAERNYNDYNILIKETSSGGANYTSKLYTAVISEANNELHLFAKVAVMNQSIRDAAKLKLFSTENYFYTKLHKLYESIEDANGLKPEHRLSVPQCYGCDPTDLHETVVLENLVRQGFKPYNRFMSIDWEYASAAVTEVAKLHALSFALNQKYPEEYFKCINRFKDAFNDELINALTKSAMDLAVENTIPEYKESVREYIDATMKNNNIMKLFDPVLKTVICHYDYRPSNLLSRRREDDTVDIKIVDLQTMQGGSPVVDLLYFIFTGSDEAFRAQHYGRLLDCYYQQLSAAMRRLRLQPDEHYSRADFDYELKEKLPFGLSIAVYTLPVVTVDVDDAPKVDEDMELSSFSLLKTNDLYVERLNGVVNDFVKWGILKPQRKP